MIDELRRALETAEKQPEDIQHRIAEAIALVLENAEWDAMVATPESQAFLEELDEEARTANATGTARDLDELLEETPAADDERQA